ncbi:MAG TPA: TraR/DksA family transcriptional regulator [Thermoanaerobaculia bacterium]|nr:TraR/DksA family transcriptional regulator [Thermoanaerobaculia bacterium]
MAKTQTAVKKKGFDAFRERLEGQRADIMSLYQNDVRSGQESTDEGTEDIVDRANNSYHRELMFSLSDAERQLMLDIDKALDRIEDGSYGRCTNCGTEIAEKRLEAVPWTRYCIDCQELAEQGMLAED